MTDRAEVVLFRGEFLVSKDAIQECKLAINKAIEEVFGSAKSEDNEMPDKAEVVLFRIEYNPDPKVVERCGEAIDKVLKPPERVLCVKCRKSVELTKNVRKTVCPSCDSCFCDSCYKANYRCCFTEPRIGGHLQLMTHAQGGLCAYLRVSHYELEPQLELSWRNNSLHTATLYRIDKLTWKAYDLDESIWGVRGVTVMDIFKERFFCLSGAERNTQSR